MADRLRILHLEDSPVDAELVHEVLGQDEIAFDVNRVDSRADYVAALDRGGFDLILADYSLPSFDGISALGIAREKCPEIPFIFVSATLGEELAVETLKGGATDYVLKQRLSRLGPSVHRALREVEQRTERMRAEGALKEKDEQLRLAQKMEALGRLAGGIAHDFNNLLTIIMGYSQVLLNELGPDHRLATQIRETQKAGNQAAMLIRQLLAFSKRQVLDTRVLDLNFIVENLEAMLGRLIGEHINLVVNKASSLGRIKADQGQLEQVLMNLVVNARDAMPKGGTITVETTNVDIRKGSKHKFGGLEPGKYVALSVRDAGCGMDEETQAKIFEPFFTTKEEGKGTGLGLSMVHGIVKQSGAWIQVHSRPGRGSTFTLYFPRTNDAPISIKQKKRVEAALNGSETILLVEDEGAVRMQIKDELSRHGYTVLEAQHAVEAFLISNQREKPIDLLLTDVVMPGMSGWDLAQQLASRRPDMKILFISGYIDDVGVVQGMSSSRAAFLQKPFTPDALATRVRELLDG